MASKQQKQTGRVNPAKPAEFSLAAFVENALKTYTITTVTNQPPVAKKLNELLVTLDTIRQARANLRARADAPDAQDKDRRLAQKAASSQELDDREAELKQQIADLMESTPGAWAQIRVDSPDPRDRQDLRRRLDAQDEADKADGGDGLLSIDHTKAHLALAGSVRAGHDGDGQDDDTGWTRIDDPDQWEQTLNAIGPTQTERVDTATAEVFYEDQGVTPDFFMRLSSYRATQA